MLQQQTLYSGPRVRLLSHVYPAAKKRILDRAGQEVESLSHVCLGPIGALGLVTEAFEQSNLLFQAAGLRSDSFPARLGGFPLAARNESDGFPPTPPCLGTSIGLPREAGDKSSILSGPSYSCGSYSTEFHSRGRSELENLA